MDSRSEIMRTRLMEATLETLAKEGWAGTSTPKICKIANVSRGAQTHHFPAKSGLILAAIDRAAQQFEAEAVAKIAALSPKQRSLRTLVSVFWETFLDDRFEFSTLEILVAARTDPDLRAEVARLDKEAICSARSFASQVSGTLAPVKRLEDALELSLYLFRGLGLERGLHDDDKHHRQLFDAWLDLLCDALE